VSLTVVALVEPDRSEPGSVDGIDPQEPERSAPLDR
jgi:hypothetical protein